MAFFNPQQHPLVPKTLIENQSSAGSRAQHLLSDDTSSSYAILSAQSQSNADVYSDVEWIVFSPRISASEDGDLDASLEDQELAVANDAGAGAGAGVGVGVGARIATGAGASAGAETPLAFPSHNGTGSFIAPSPSDIAERVNAWRVDQSKFVLKELHRLFGDGSIQSQQQYFEDQEPAVGTQDLERGSRPRGFWEGIRKKILVDFVGMNDQVLHMLFGDVDWQKLEQEEREQKQKQQMQQEESDTGYQGTHFKNAIAHGPPDWDSELVSKIVSHFQFAPSSEMSLLKLITSRLLDHYNQNYRARKANSQGDLNTAVPSTTQSVYWNEESYSSSNYWETSSINSTRVW